jgi:hypothetical protein
MKVLFLRIKFIVLFIGPYDLVGVNESQIGEKLKSETNDLIFFYIFSIQYRYFQLRYKFNVIMKDMKNIYNYQQPSYLHFIHILKKTEDRSHYPTCQKQQEVVPFSFLCHCFSTLTRMRREGVSCSIVFNQIKPDPAVFDRIQPC